MTPLYEKRQEWAKRPEDIKDIITEGSKHARTIAEKTMADVRKAMKIGWI